MTFPAPLLRQTVSICKRRRWAQLCRAVPPVLFAGALPATRAAFVAGRKMRVAPGRTATFREICVSL